MISLSIPETYITVLKKKVKRSHLDNNKIAELEVLTTIVCNNDTQLSILDDGFDDELVRILKEPFALEMTYSEERYRWDSLYFQGSLRKLHDGFYLLETSKVMDEYSDKQKIQQKDYKSSGQFKKSVLGFVNDHIAKIMSNWNSKNSRWNIGFSETGFFFYSKQIDASISKITYDEVIDYKDFKNIVFISDGKDEVIYYDSLKAFPQEYKSLSKHIIIGGSIFLVFLGGTWMMQSESDWENFQSSDDYMYYLSDEYDQIL
jgi:hypothetical protein